MDHIVKAALAALADGRQTDESEGEKSSTTPVLTKQLDEHRCHLLRSRRQWEKQAKEIKSSVGTH